MSLREDLTERPVMSGLGFFLDGRMAVAVLDDRLCLHIGDAEDAGLSESAALPFEFAGRPVRGWVCIPEESLDEASLTNWVALAVSGLGLSM
jgi:hypothetical protein